MIPETVLVTGAAGFLGGAVVDRLLALPAVRRVVGVDVRPMERKGPGHVLVERDVTEGIRDVLTDEGVGAVVHHAFVMRPPRRPGDAEAVNVDATARLVTDAGAADVTRIVYPSSATVYGASPESAAHTEKESPRPVPGFSYSEHKVAAEQVLLDADIESVVILRGCVIAGPGASGFVLASLALPLLPIVAGADPEMQFLHVDDYADAVAAALEAPRSGTFNIAGQGTIRVREMARLVGSRTIPLPAPVLRSLVRWSWRLRLQGRSPASGLEFITHPWLVSIEAAARELGWRPQYSSREAITAWAEWRRR